MSDNYIRDCAVTFDAIGTTYDATGIRVRFKIRQSTLGSANTATILLTNQNPGLAKQLCDPKSEGTKVSVSAGYVGNSGLLFQGDLRRAIYGRENPTDTLTTILAAGGGQAMSHATIAKTLPKGSTPQNIVDAVSAEMGKFGVNFGFAGQSIDLSQPVYPRAIALFGMAWKHMRDVAQSKGATASVQNDKIHLMGPNDNVPGGPWELNSQTGLIGMPTLETGALFARTLINPQMVFGTQVHIDESLIQGYLPGLLPGGQVAPQFDSRNTQLASIAGDGIYTIFAIDVDADTRGGPWYQDLQMNNASAAMPTPAQVYASGQANNPAGP